MQISPLLESLLIGWGVITGVLIVLVIVRSNLASHEDDQIFLDSAEHSLAEEQQVLVARINKLSRPITVLVVASGGLLLVIAGMWLWEGFKNF